MLGHGITDPHCVEAATEGLGLLPLQTEFQSSKRYQHGTYKFAALTGFWTPLSSLSFDAYEIRHGLTTEGQHHAGGLSLQPALPNGCGWQRGEVLALYTHGIFENAGVLRALFGRSTPTLDDTFEGLADYIEEHIGARMLMSLLS